MAAGAGVFFAADLIFWHHAIADVGAGLATVLGNLQVVIIPFAAWAILGERIERRILVALPLVCSGVLLISGVLESGAYGDHPLRGVLFGFLTGLTYAGFILVLRQGSGDLRRPAGPLFDATAVAAVVAIAAGLAVGDADLVPSWPAHGWLVCLALTSQVVGWLLIIVSAAAAARRADLGDADDPARRLGDPRRDPARRGADRAPARRRRVHPRRAALDRAPAGCTFSWLTAPRIAAASDTHSGGQPLLPPRRGLVVANPVDAVVEAVLAALPELDRERDEPIAAPVLRARDVIARIALHGVGERRVERVPRGDRRALARRPGAEPRAAARARRSTRPTPRPVSRSTTPSSRTARCCGCQYSVTAARGLASSSRPLRTP